MIDYQQILDTANDIFAGQGDKPFVNQRARDLRALLDQVIKATQAGAGDFKWSAKNVRELVKMNGKTAFLIVARDGSDVWHGNGYYMKRGEPSARFGKYEPRDMSIAQMRSVIPADRGEVVTVTDGDAEHVYLSNGTKLNRLLLAYALDGVTEPTMYQSSMLTPVTIVSGGEAVALVMPTLTV